MGIVDNLTFLLWNLYADQEATVRTDIEHRTGCKLGKEYVKAVYCHLAYYLLAEYILLNAGLDEAQAEIKTARRNINNLSYADDTVSVADSKKELKSHLMKVKEENEKAGLKFSI